MKRYFYGIDEANRVWRCSTKHGIDYNLRHGYIVRPLLATSSEVRSAKHLASKGEEWPIQLS